MSQNGKGDAPRPVDQKKWEENYSRIFGPKRGAKKPHAKARQNTK